MQLEIRIPTSTAHIDRREWDRLSANRPFASYDWYRMGENVLPSIRRWYVLIYDGGENIARATFWLTRQDPLPLSSKVEKLAFGVLLSIRPLLVCRSPLADWTGLILPNDSRRAEALRLICSSAVKIGKDQRASFITFDYLDANSLAEDWHALRYTRFDIADPGTCVHLGFSCFEDYLKTLPKSAYKDFRRHTNQARKRKIEVLVQDRVTDPDAALQLIRTVERRHNSAPKPWTSDLLEYGAKGGISWLAAYQEKRLVGCGMVLKDHDICLATLLGLDYSVEYVYFQLMYAAIRNAIDHGALALRAGSGAYSFKKQLGFYLEDNHHLTYSGLGTLFKYLGQRVGGKE